MNILHNSEDSEECINDTLLQAWNTIPPQKPSKLRMYLAKIIRNISFNRYNAKKSQKRGSGEISLVLDELSECIASEDNVENTYAAKELGIYLKQFVKKLPDRERNIFVRRYFFTESIDEIAKRYNLSQNNVMVILSRTRKSLKSELTKEGFLS